MIWILLSAIVMLVVQIIVTDRFCDITEAKGYPRNTYYWYCFLLGVVGYMMVLALPDRNLYAKIDALTNAASKPADPVQHNIPTAPVQPAAPVIVATAEASPNAIIAPIVNGEKVCPVCKTVQMANRKVCWSCGQHFSN